MECVAERSAFAKRRLMSSVAVLLPCERPFDEFGYPIVKQVLEIETKYDVIIYIGIKRSVYDKSTKKSDLPDDKIIYVFEPEDTHTTSVSLNLAWRLLREDYLITLADDFLILGNFFLIIKFVQNIIAHSMPPIAILGVSGEDSDPNEINYYKHFTGIGGSKRAHPIFRATPWFAAEVNFLRGIFKDELFPEDELYRYYADELFAFRIQYKYKYVMPIFVNDAIRVRDDLAPCKSPPIKGMSSKSEYNKYITIVRQIEQTDNLFPPITQSNGSEIALASPTAAHRHILNTKI